jgi:chromosome segregation ATPase
MRVELEAKLRPLQDQLRQSRAKLDGLSSTTDSSLRKLREALRNLTQKVEFATSSIEKQQSELGGRFAQIEPKVSQLEAILEDLEPTLTAPGEGTPVPTALAGQFRQLQIQAEKLESETIPIRIQASSDQVLERLSAITGACKKELAQLTSRLDSMRCTNQVADQQRAHIDSSLDQLLKGAFEIQSSLQSLDQDTSARLTELDRSVEAASKSLDVQLADARKSSSEDDGQAGSRAISDLRAKVAKRCRKLKAEIRAVTAANDQSQRYAVAEISKARNLLKGQGNLLPRLAAIEARVAYCVNLIQAIDRERVAAQEKGGGARAVADRMRNIEDRLANANTRLPKQGGEKSEPPPAPLPDSLGTEIDPEDGKPDDAPVEVPAVGGDLGQPIEGGEPADENASPDVVDGAPDDDAPADPAPDGDAEQPPGAGDAPA